MQKTMEVILRVEVDALSRITRNLGRKGAAHPSVWVRRAEKPLFSVVIRVRGGHPKLLVDLVEQFLRFGSVSVHIELVRLLGCTDALESLLGQPLRSGQVRMFVGGDVVSRKLSDGKTAGKRDCSERATQNQILFRHEILQRDWVAASLRLVHRSTRGL
jgi:hypothetical protein